jgi:hypothetical protein
MMLICDYAHALKVFLLYRQQRIYRPLLQDLTLISLGILGEARDITCMSILLTSQAKPSPSL